MNYCNFITCCILSSIPLFSFSEMEKTSWFCSSSFILFSKAFACFNCVFLQLIISDNFFGESHFIPFVLTIPIILSIYCFHSTFLFFALRSISALSSIRCILMVYTCFRMSLKALLWYCISWFYFLTCSLTSVQHLFSYSVVISSFTYSLFCCFQYRFRSLSHFILESCIFELSK